MKSILEFGKPVPEPAAAAEPVDEGKRAAVVAALARRLALQPGVLFQRIVKSLEETSHVLWDAEDPAAFIAALGEDWEPLRQELEAWINFLEERKPGSTEGIRKTVLAGAERAGISDFEQEPTEGGRGWDEPETGQLGIRT